jgi:hypothetical protein
MRPLPIETTGEGPPLKKEAALGGAALTRIGSSVRTIHTPRRCATVKASSADGGFTATLVQALGECLARVIVADSGGASALLDIYCRMLRAMTSVKRAFRRWRRSTLKGGG